MSNAIDADEAFARRLQAQEMGLQIEQTPLMIDRAVSNLNSRQR